MSRNIIIHLIFDNEEEKNIIKVYIENDGYNILTTDSDTFLKNGLDAIPDLIIISCENETLIEVTHKIKTKLQTKIIPVIALIESSAIADIDKTLNAGILDIITKPIDNKVLSTRLRIGLAKQNILTKFHTELEEFKQIKELADITTKSSNSICITDTNGEIEWINQGFADLFNLNRELNTKVHLQEIDSNSRLFFKKALKQKKDSQKLVQYESLWQKENNKEVWIQTTLTPVFKDNTEEIEKIIAISTDITSRKKAEKKLEEQNTELLITTKRLETTNEILEHQSQELAKERGKSEELLLNILPYTVAKQLKTKGYSNLRKYRLVTVMFTDFKGFTQLAEQLPTETLIEQLSFYFDKFDDIVDKHYIEKIKTIGDSYMCAGGLPLRNKSNPINVTLASLEIQEFAKAITEEQKNNNSKPWGLRLGIHSGEVIAGVIGKKKFAYDIWGDTVNTASRMESSGEVGKVNISGDTYKYLKDYFECSFRGKVNVKHKGEMEMYFVNRLKPEFSSDTKGIYPNEVFKKILSGF